MNRKIPLDAFDYYFSLGPGRGYQAVADKYGVSKRAVANLARREDWQSRIAEIERKARDRGDEKKVESLEEMNERHLKMLKAIQGRALQTLQTLPLASAMDAVRAIKVCIEKERIIRGEPADHTAMDVEQVIKREYEQWLVPGREDGKGDVAEEDSQNE